MAKTRLQTRADSDTANAVDDFADEHNLSQSEAVRRIIRAGLSQYDYQIPTADGMGTGQLQELRHELSEMEQRQAARANQRERLEVAQAASLVAVLSYLIFVFGLGASGPLWTLVGVMAAVGTVISYLWAFKLGGGDDE